MHRISVVLGLNGSKAPDRGLRLLSQEQAIGQHVPRPAALGVALQPAAEGGGDRYAPLPRPFAHDAQSPSLAVLLDIEGPEYHLDPCPNYVESLGGKQAVSSYQLNCSPVGALPPGGSAVFEMRLAVPAALAAGATRLSWALLNGRLATPPATTTITIL